MRSLFDVNVLIALLHPEHAHHGAAHQWWSANRAHGWASCPLTQNGFVRIVSQPKYPQPISVAHALEVLAEETAGTDHMFWADDISLTDAKRFAHERIFGPKQLTDIYLLGLAVENGGRLVTFDRSIPVAAVRGAAKRHVVLI